MNKLKKTLSFSIGVALTATLVSVPPVLAFTLNKNHKTSLDYAKQVGAQEKEKLISFFQNENEINNTIKFSKSQKKDLSQTWNESYEKVVNIGKIVEEKKYALATYLKVLEGFGNIKKEIAKKTLNINVSTKKFNSFKNYFSAIVSANEKNIEKNNIHIERSLSIRQRKRKREFIEIRRGVIRVGDANTKIDQALRKLNHV